jgi:hypothetical protein
MNTPTNPAPTTRDTQANAPLPNQDNQSIAGDVQSDESNVTVANLTSQNITTDDYTNIQSANDDFNNIYAAIGDISS